MRIQLTDLLCAIGDRHGEEYGDWLVGLVYQTVLIGNTCGGRLFCD